ncbi:cupin domain-containing protein [Candidatus Bathyarchaeota archaeon]|nr:cupin domain-containing protein [Candidatus Bathyarchaeota archaeon]
MKIFPCTSIESKKADCCPSKVHVRKLITKFIGANNFAMRLFEIYPEGNTPLHTHPWEHEVFILEGEGTIFNGEESSSFKTNDVVFVAPDERHQFKNTGKTLLKFLCLIPYIKE